MARLVIEQQGRFSHH